MICIDIFIVCLVNDAHCVTEASSTLSHTLCSVLTNSVKDSYFQHTVAVPSLKHFTLLNTTHQFPLAL